MIGQYLGQLDWPANPFVIQVGAHDGVSLDPVSQLIRNGKWKGVLLEPQPEIFDRLRRNHSGDRFCLENAAIASKDGFITLYTINGDGLPDHATMLASSNRKAVEKNGHGYTGKIKRVVCRAMSVKSLLEKYNVKELTLLQVDAEGMDASIVLMFLRHIRPSVIHFEHAICNPVRLWFLIAALLILGYKVERHGIDTLCIRSTKTKGNK